jgi:hypothetical protein
MKSKKADQNTRAVVYKRTSTPTLKDQQPTELLEQAADFGFSPDEIEMIPDDSDDRVGHEHLRG